MSPTMSNEGNGLLTTPERENNPKAVFYGDNFTIINPLALYLSERNVDLFSGKTLDDALYGDYFFYVGAFTQVKEFLAQKGNEIPKA